MVKQATNRRTAALLLAIPILIGAGLLLLATSKYGVGVTRDSISYMDAAASLISSGRLQTNTGTDPLPLTTWPPFYPALLSVFLLFTSRTEQANIILNVIALGAYVAAIEYIVLRSTRGSLSVSLAAGLFAATALSTQYIFTRALSEPPYLALFAIAIILLYRQLEKPRTGNLLLLSALIGAAWLTRYVGLSLVVTAGLAILIWEQRALARRFADAILLGLISTFPFAIMAVRHYQLKEAVASRGVVFAIAPVGWWQFGYESVSKWLMPDAMPALLRHGSAAFTLAMVLVGLYYTIQHATRAASTAPQEERTWLYPALFALQSVIYITIYFAVVSVYDPTIDLDSRGLSPVFTAVIIIAAYGVHALLQQMSGKRLVQYAVVTLFALVFVFQFARSVRYAYNASQIGMSYNGAQYWQSEALGAIENSPEQLPVYSNNRQLVHYLSGLPVTAISLSDCTGADGSNVANVTSMADARSQIVWVEANDIGGCGAWLNENAESYGYSQIADDGLMQVYSAAESR